MRAALRVALALGFFGTFLILMMPPSDQKDPKTDPVTITANKILRHYHPNVPAGAIQNDPFWILAVSKSTHKWCELLGYRGQEEWILSLIAVESDFNPWAEGTAEEVGLGQTTPNAAAFYGARLRAKGFDGEMIDPDWQIALTVAEFGYHLERAAGDPRLAAERYNGRGPAARRHAAKVVAFHASTFHLPTP